MSIETIYGHRWVMNLSDVINSLFILNLDNRPDRLAAVTKELHAAGLELCAGKIERFSAIRPDDAKGFPSVGAHGVFLSHLAILREAKARGLSHYAILEDDLAFCSAFLERHDKVAREIADGDWDLVWLGSTLPFEGNTDSERIFQVYKAPILTATCTVIHSRIYERLEQFFLAVLDRPPGHPLGGPQHIDGAYNMFRDQNPDVSLWLANPELVEQRGFVSDIQDRSWYYRVPLLSQALSGALRLKRALRRPS